VTRPGPTPGAARPAPLRRMPSALPACRTVSQRAFHAPVCIPSHGRLAAIGPADVRRSPRAWSGYGTWSVPSAVDAPAVPASLGTFYYRKGAVMSGSGKRAEGRSVTVVVCDDSGSLLGSLGPFDVVTPWWQDLEPVRCRFPMLTVLRLLHGTPGDGGAFGGQVTYLAESGPGLTCLRPGWRSIPRLWPIIRFACRGRGQAARPQISTGPYTPRQQPGRLPPGICCAPGRRSARPGSVPPAWPRTPARCPPPGRCRCPSSACGTVSCWPPAARTAAASRPATPGHPRPDAAAAATAAAARSALPARPAATAFPQHGRPRKPSAPCWPASATPPGQRPAAAMPSASSPTSP
jgi:hypothetical protein